MGAGAPPRSGACQCGLSSEQCLCVSVHLGPLSPLSRARPRGGPPRAGICTSSVFVTRRDTQIKTIAQPTSHTGTRPPTCRVGRVAVRRARASHKTHRRVGCRGRGPGSQLARRVDPRASRVHPGRAQTDGPYPHGRSLACTHSVTTRLVADSPGRASPTRPERERGDGSAEIGTPPPPPPPRLVETLSARPVDVAGPRALLT